MAAIAGSLEWSGDRLSLRRASLGDVPGVAFYREGVDAVGPTGGGSPVGWFSLGGPWMHEHFCSRHVRVYLNVGWDCWVVERGDGTVAGSVEICYAVEPPPYYDTPTWSSWKWPTTSCAARSRSGYSTDASSVPSGGSLDVLARRGYVERWRNGWVTVLDLGSVKAPVHHEGRLLGDYDGEAAHLLALNHRESASYRWRYLWQPALAPEASDFPTDMSLSGRSVTLRGRAPANVLVNVWRWREPAVCLGRSVGRS